MTVTNEFERDLNDTSFLGRPGRVDMVVFQNVADAGDGYPGLQRAFRNYLHDGGMENDIDMNDLSIINIDELVFPSATIHSSGTHIHIHPNTGNADGELHLHPLGTNTASIIFIRNSGTANYGDFQFKIDGLIASLESGLGSGGTAPDTLNMNNSNWDNINIGDASAVITLNAVTITAAEFGEIANINTTTISATQWGYLGDLNQALHQSQSPTFVGLTLSGVLITNSTVDGVDVSSHTHNGAGQGGTVPFSSLSGDIVYTQLDSIVDVSGVGSANLISGAEHVHTNVDGSSKVSHSNLLGLSATDHHATVYFDTPSDDLVFSNNTQRQINAPVYAVIKEITVYRNCNIRVYWEGARQSGQYAGYTRVYVNGGARGSEHGEGTSYMPHNEDVSVLSGQTVAIWGYCTLTVEPYGPGNIMAQNQRIKFIDYKITSGK